VLYEAAILEFNPNLLQQRVNEAKKAIHSRWRADRQLGDNTEDKYLRDALWALDQLFRMRTESAR
jgi:hypothetical protein